MPTAAAPAAPAARQSPLPAAPFPAETLINGVLQGRKQFDPRGASSVSRRSMALAAVAVLARLGLSRMLLPLATPALARAGPAPVTPTAETGAPGTIAGNNTGSSSSTATVSPTPSSPLPPSSSCSSHSFSYSALKNHPLLLSTRQRVKADAKRLALKGWHPNLPDDDFSMSLLSSFAEKREEYRRS
jgi:tRNA-specific adenosine deaminase 1